MLTETTVQTKSATVAEIDDHRGSGKIQIAHQFLDIPPFWVDLPAHLSVSVGKIRLQRWVNQVYPKHIVVA